MFEENKRRYDDALKDSGFQGRLEYLTPVDLNSRARKNNNGTPHTPQGKVRLLIIVVTEIDEERIEIEK